MSSEAMGAGRVDDMKRALSAIRDLRRRVAELEAGAREPVAIIGMSCRLPGGANTPEKLWELLRNGVDATREVPADRWDADAIYDSDPEAPGRAYVRRAGFLNEAVDRFDAAFFGISPREADAMDPLHRLLLEMSWEALESAAIPAHTIEGSDAGVFIGISGSDYELLQRNSGIEINSYRGTGTISSVAAGRISHFLGTHGPNVALDTACSSMLVALALAVDAIRSGRCSLAFAGSSHLMLSPEGTIALCKLRALAAEGRCRTFDAAASGYARAEGGGMFLLKKLSVAQADGDPILGVIRGAAVNHDGRSSGLTVPNPNAQRALIESALEEAGLTAADVTYVEAHGTATPLGDPIELRALADALGRNRPADRPLMLGSIKTNIGHLEPAAGAAALAKVLLSLRNRQIPPHLHLTQPTPHVPWNELNLTVPTTLTEWNAERRIAGISGFGFSGTNAHIIVEEAPAREADTRPARPAELIVLSGRSRAAVTELAARYSEHLAARSDNDLPDLAATSLSGRTALPFRAFAVGSDAAEMRAALDELAADESRVAHFKGATTPPLAMLFTGQGAQYPGMARELYETSTVFRAELDRCAAILEAHMDVPLLPLVLDADRGDALRQTANTQPALFAVEYATAMLWRSWGVEPDFVVGHSLGEYVAATIAGVMRLEDALPLVALRGRLMQQLPAGGRMVAVQAPEADVAAAISGVTGVSIAAVNAPSSTVVSGEGDVVQQIVDRMTQAGVQCKELEVSHAFHSALMEPMLAEFERAIAAMPLAAPTIPLVSNLTGDLLTAQDAVDPVRWRRHIREPVRFSESMQRLADLGVKTFLEVGPHPTLCGLGAQTITTQAAWLPSLRRNVGAWKQLAQSAGELFRNGCPLDWESWGRDFAGRRTNGTPRYAFQRERYWFTEGIAAKKRSARGHSVDAALAAHPLLGGMLQSPALDGWAFQTTLDPQSPAYLVDHQVQGTVIVPGAAFIEMMLAAAREGPLWLSAALRDVTFEAPLVLPDDGEVLCQVLVTTPDGGRARVRVVTRAEDGTWTTHASATALAEGTGADTHDLTTLRAEMATPVSTDDVYDWLAAHGIPYGPAFRGLKEIRTGEAGALGHAVLPPEAGDAGGYAAHPCMLDLAFQLIKSLVSGDEIYLPAGVDSLSVHSPVGTSCWIHAALRADAQSNDIITADLRIFDEAGSCVAELDGFRARRLRGALVRRPDADPVYDISWETVTAPALPKSIGGTWLILEDAAGAGAQLAASLTQRGARCIRVSRSSAATADVITCNPATMDWTALLRDEELQGVVHLWSLDDAPRSGDGAVWLEHALDITATLPDLLRTDAVARAPQGLRIVTRGALGPTHERKHGSEGGAAVVALLRVVHAEYPELACRAVDLDPRSIDLAGDDLLALIVGDTTEDRLVQRSGQMLAPRLVRGAHAVESGIDIPEGEAYCIDIERRGTLDAIRYVPVTRVAPGAGEVEVRVRTTGLNFRDVLNVLGMYPGEPGPPGVEFAGVVTRVGAGVTNVAVGDEVIGIGEAAFASYVTGPAAAVSPKPRNLDAVEAVTIPLAFLTAEWGLTDLAQMRAGDRVLIHSAAGGVGQAAVHLALACGAEVFATAGSDEKRAYLRAQGVQHVFDSRSTSFAEGVRAATNGEGVDIVLNSLTGDLLHESLRLLRTGGRFLEIGKAEILTDADLAARYPDIRYAAYDLGSVLLREPDTFQSLFRRVIERFEGGELRPLATRVYAAAHVVDAFRFMAQARHIGKVVVTAARPAAPGIRSDGAYLVTGASGGIGRVLAEWLVDNGAGRVFLNGRSRPGPELSSWLDQLSADVAERVEWVQGDVAARADADRIIERIRDAGVELRGVFHAAGVLDDALIREQTRERFRGVMAAKIAGAWNLHEATRRYDLDHFVLFSSVASLLGGPGQSSYAAANGFLDALAESRTREGLAALSVNWGAWGDAGMAARLDERERRMLEDRGLGFLSADTALDAMHRLMSDGCSRAVVAEVDWSRVAAAARRTPPLLARMLEDVRPAAGAGQTVTKVRAIDMTALLQAEPAARDEMIGSYVRTTLASVLGIRGGPLEDDAEIGHLGFDSLMAMELRNRIETDMGVLVPVAQLLGSATPRAIASEVGLALGGDTSLAPAAPAMESFDF